jgi:hypothetical protein
MARRINSFSLSGISMLPSLQITEQMAALALALLMCKNTEQLGNKVMPQSQQGDGRQVKT